MNLFSGRLNKENYVLGEWITLLSLFVFYFLFRFTGLPFTWPAFILPGLPSLIFSYSVGSRRLHDIGRSGWIQLFYLAFFRSIFGSYLFLKKGSDTVNKYGAPPKTGFSLKAVFGISEG